jgi:hypothetical protein
MPPAPEFHTAEIQDPLPGMKLGVAVATATGLALLIALHVYNGVCFQSQNGSGRRSL